jgi:hypothetical protein
MLSKDIYHKSVSKFDIAEQLKQIISVTFVRDLMKRV